MFIGKMYGQERIEKIRKYLDYLEKHLENVRRAHDEVMRACSKMWLAKDDAFWHTLQQAVCEHDMSKFSAEEFIQYANAFYPDRYVDEQAKAALATAWEHHKANNPHHNESATCDLDLVHMVIDWTAMGYKFGDTAEQFYRKHAAEMNFSDAQVDLLNEIFACIAAAKSKSTVEGKDENV
jgi:hypothetical protein